MQPRRGERVDEPVGADLARAVDADRDRHGARAGDEERPLPARGDRLERGGQRRHDRGAARSPETSANDASSSRSSPSSSSSSSSAVARARRRRAARRDERARPEQAERDVRVADVDREEHGRDDTRRGLPGTSAGWRYHRGVPSARPEPPPSAPRLEETRSCRASPPAKFFVNQGVVSSRDRHARTCSGRSSSRRSRTATSAAASSSPTAPAGSSGSSSTHPETRPTSRRSRSRLNIDSFEHLEFETRPDQLLVYTLVQGDERVIIEFAPIGAGGEDASPFAPRQLEFDTSGFVQMELLGPRRSAATDGRPGPLRAPALAADVRDAERAPARRCRSRDAPARPER